MATNPVAALLRESDPERFFADLFAPEAARADLMALHAFAGELARIRDLVREPAMGEVRLQWWREAIEGRRASEAQAHPLALAMLQAIARHRLPTQPLLAMIEARRFDLYDDPIPSRNDLEGYLGETAGAVLHLSVLVLAPGFAMGASDLSGHGGCALGIAELVRRLPLHRRRGQCHVPDDLLAQAGTDRAGLLAGEVPSADAVAAFARVGLEHLDAFREAANIPPAVRPVFLPVAAAGRVLIQARNHPEQALRDGVPMSPVGARWAMLKAAMGAWPKPR